jgi:hypothetical protein
VGSIAEGPGFRAVFLAAAQLGYCLLIFEFELEGLEFGALVRAVAKWVFLGKTTGAVMVDLVRIHITNPRLKFGSWFGGNTCRGKVAGQTVLSFLT